MLPVFAAILCVAAATTFTNPYVVVDRPKKWRDILRLPPRVMGFVTIAVPMLFALRLLSVNSPDPGVMLFKGTYYAVTTSGDDANTFPIFV
jgi:hypothetical protein